MRVFSRFIHRISSRAADARAVRQGFRGLREGACSLVPGGSIGRIPSTMQELRETFERVFGIPFETLPIPKQPLRPISESSMLLGSLESTEHLFLSQMETLQFDTFSPVNYFLVGFWGHGINSYAFYYERNDGHNNICFRLPYGGLYEDNERDAAEIARFLPSFFAFERQLKNRDLNLVAIDSMGEGRYQIVTLHGVQSEYTNSLLGSYNFTEALGISA